MGTGASPGTGGLTSSDGGTILPVWPDTVPLSYHEMVACEVDAHHLQSLKRRREPSCEALSIALVFLCPYKFGESFKAFSKRFAPVLESK